MSACVGQCLSIWWLWGQLTDIFISAFTVSRLKSEVRGVMSIESTRILRICQGQRRGQQHDTALDSGNLHDHFPVIRVYISCTNEREKREKEGWPLSNAVWSWLMLIEPVIFVSAAVNHCKSCGSVLAGAPDEHESSDWIVYEDILWPWGDETLDEWWKLLPYTQW